MGKWSPKIVAFLCTWCSYAGADLAGTGRNQYPPNIRVIRVPCSGRINPIYIIKALLEGADGVMVSGCHPGDCHYLVGNYYARRRFTVLKKLLTTAGIEPNRVHFTWVSASEGVRFADVVRDVTEKVSTLGPNLITGDDSSDTSPIEKDNKKTSVFSDKSEEPAPLVHLAQPLPNNNYLTQQEQLIPLCKKLLEDGVANTVVAFQAGGETGLSQPYIFTLPEDAENLVWNNRCVPNLSGYLAEIKGKKAVVAKPCDARAIVSLIKEKQLNRDDLYIIGITCNGLVDEDGKPLPCCDDCHVRVPPVYDVLIWESHEDTDDDKPEDKSGHGHSEKALDESIERFAEEMRKCILCYSCRQTCYGCYCKTCFVERGEPDWLTASPDIGAKMLYHLGRATHLSGRCVECGACESACASGVNIRYLIKAVTDFIADTYDYKSGMDLETEPAMLTYKADDAEIGFLGYKCASSVEPGNNNCAGGDSDV